MAEKFLVVMEIETESLAKTMDLAVRVLQDNIPDLKGSAWTVRGILIDDVRGILEARGKF